MIQTKIFSPRDYQVEAITKVIDGFAKENRGKIIMPCGTGKSWTYLWLNETMGNKSTIIFVPSLTLIKQIKNDWLEQRTVDFEYLCVCSDADVDNEEDSSVEEIGGNVSSNPDDIRTFLIENLNTNTVIFSTYHSADKVAEALKGVKYSFDLLICDEAHRTAGIDNAFGIVHNNELIPAKKRLYGTATPRVLGKRTKKNEGREYYDMNDEAIYGKVFYRLSFKDSIKNGIICDYKLIVVGVNDKDIIEMVDNGADVSSAVNTYALKYCLKKYNLDKVISFHSTVRRAEFFSKSLNDAKITSFHINGKMSGTAKDIILNNFANTKSVITNARCLTEGVNIPTIDGIFYGDKRNSIIDIIQATGRALRKAKGKELGYIIVPLYNITPENIEDVKLDFLINVVSSICVQDDDLKAEFNDLVRSESKDKRKSFKENDKFLFENVNLELTDKIFDIVIDGIGRERNTFEENVELFKQGDPIHLKYLRSMWNRQYKEGKLTEDKIKILNEIGALERVIKTFEERVEDFKLGLNVSRLKCRWREYFRKGTLTEDKIKILNEIGALERTNKTFEESIEDYKQGLNATKLKSRWIQQYKEGKLTEDKIKILNEIGAFERKRNKKKSFEENVELFKQGSNKKNLKAMWRKSYRKGTLLEAKIKILTAIAPNIFD